MTRAEMAYALMVALPNPDNWNDACPAWIESAGRQCGRPRDVGYLCKRHHGVAVRRAASQVEKDAREAQKAAERRAEKLPMWKAELAGVEANMRRLDPDTASPDRAAYIGNVHPSIRKQRARLWSDSRVQEMAQLVRRAEQLRSLIGRDA